MIVHDMWVDIFLISLVADAHLSDRLAPSTWGSGVSIDFSYILVEVLIARGFRKHNLDRLLYAVIYNTRQKTCIRHSSRIGSLS